MSLGYAGHARLELEDAEIAIYSYTGEDWKVQDESARKALESAIGQFTIYKSCFIEPEVHCKVRKTPNGRKKLIEKKVVGHPDLSGLIDDGGIVIAASTPKHRTTAPAFTYTYCVISSKTTS